jgi:hypothetical protein
MPAGVCDGGDAGRPGQRRPYSAGTVPGTAPGRA